MSKKSRYKSQYMQPYPLFNANVVLVFQVNMFISRDYILFNIPIRINPELVVKRKINIGHKRFHCPLSFGWVFSKFNIYIVGEVVIYRNSCSYFNTSADRHRNEWAVYITNFQLFSLTELNKILFFSNFPMGSNYENLMELLCNFLFLSFCSWTKMFAICKDAEYFFSWNS